MHDVGKIKIPDSILNKPGRLTEEEYEVMKKHSEYGGAIIEKTIGGGDGREIQIHRCQYRPAPS